jgi:hypothetical protein
MDSGKGGKGASTNASEAVDDIELPSKPSTDEKVDAGVKETFPASDPVSVAHPPGGTRTTQPPQLPKRSPDWMFDRK